MEYITNFDAVNYTKESDLFWFFKGGLCWSVKTGTEKVVNGPYTVGDEAFENMPTHIDAVSYNPSSDKYWIFKDESVWYKNLGKSKSTQGPYSKNKHFTGVPHHLDAATYDTKNGKYWFFKAGLCWSKDYKNGNINGPSKLYTEFPELEGKVTSLDAVTYNSKDNCFWFFKGDECWSLAEDSTDLQKNTIQEIFGITDGHTNNPEAYARLFSNYYFSLQTNVLINTPHNGPEILNKIYERTETNTDCDNKLVIANDGFTRNITEQILTKYREQNAISLNYNIAMVTRADIDFNRKPACAYKNTENDWPAEIYKQFHSQITNFQQSSGHRNVLFDLHGFKSTEAGREGWADIRIGSDNYLSATKELVQKVVDVINDSQGIIEVDEITKNDEDECQKKIVKKKLKADDAVDGPLNGGYIVQKYGMEKSPTGKHQQAIQIEISDRVRKNGYNRELFSWIFVQVAEAANEYISNLE